MNYIKYLSVLCFISFQHNILSQTSIKFEENTAKIDANVALQVKEIYKEAKNNSEILITVLSKKEKKKLSQKDQIKYSRIRINKIAHFLEDSLKVNPVNMAIQINPFTKKQSASNSSEHPVVGVTWTQANYKPIAGIVGEYQLVVFKISYFVASGEINDSINGVIKRKINCDKSNYIYGNYTVIYIPANSLDCSCNEINFELKEFFSPSELLLSGLTTTSGGKTLVTGGMIHIMAYCNGKEVSIIKDSKIEITFTTITKSFGVFYGTERNNIIDWKQDKDIKTELIPFVMDEEESEDGSEKLKILVDKFGWINCDVFLKDGPKSELLVDLQKPSEKTYVRLIFNDIKSVLPGYFNDKDKSTVVFKNIPDNKKASLFVYEIINDSQIKWAILDLKTGKVKEITNLNFQTTNYSEFKKIADKIW